MAETDNLASEQTRVLGVSYRHVFLPDASDLYVTSFGIPFIENLLPGNFLTDREWFAGNSRSLFGHDVRSAGNKHAL